MSSMWTSSMNSTWGPLGRCQAHPPPTPAPCPSSPTPPTWPGPGTHAGDDLCLALLPPLGHLGVDLLSDFGLDLPCVACGRQGLG